MCGVCACVDIPARLVGCVGDGDTFFEGCVGEGEVDDALAFPDAEDLVPDGWAEDGVVLRSTDFEISS